jgi:hypothetical protein
VTAGAPAGGSGRLAELGGLVRLDRLPELGRVHWRPRVDDRSLDRTARRWTLCTIAHAAPFVAGAVVLTVALPVTAPIALVLIAHAWVIPELYAARGASVLRTRGGQSEAAELVAVGLLGDLLDHRRRELHAQTRLVLERGELGTWLLGDGGAALVRPGGHRVNCYCVKVTDPGLPPSDRIAHLLLALRADEAGFATVANLVFSGAGWRLRRRLPAGARTGLDAAVAQARTA